VRIIRNGICPAVCCTIQRIALAAKNNDWKCPVLNCPFQSNLTAADKNHSFRLHISKAYLNSNHENY
jgi:hypothetical protein